MLPKPDQIETEKIKGEPCEEVSNILCVQTGLLFDGVVCPGWIKWKGRSRDINVNKKISLTAV